MTTLTKIWVRFYPCTLMYLCTLLLTSGCATRHRASLTNVFPSDIHNVCLEQLNAAREGIERVHGPVTVKYGCLVKKHPGTHKVGNIWAWHYPGIGLVGGLTMGRLVEIGSDPETGQINPPHYLLHEFGHYWLIMATGDGSHNPAYDETFHWSHLDER